MNCVGSGGPIDHSVYPDAEPPSSLNTIWEQVDYLVRLCSAWDFGVLPDHRVVEEVRRPTWRQAVDACRLLTSPAYHLLRQWHGLPKLPYIGCRLAHIQDDPNLQYV
ncbi:MAG: hypothetical protein QHH07_09625 [Sedimentisphaerales bacterium]|nr:hypothetical protein [Sedimentisphaerales bacterium]